MKTIRSGAVVTVFAGVLAGGGWWAPGAPRPGDIALEPVKDR